MLSPRLLRDLLDTRGGFTVCPVTGSTIGRGVSVAVAPHLSSSFPRRTWRDDRVAAWVRRCGGELASGRFVGGWLDHASGQVWLDVVCVLPSAERALLLARRLGQRCVYDLEREALLTAGSC